jgi:hypothetical protein
MSAFGSAPRSVGETTADALVCCRRPMDWRAVPLGSDDSVVAHICHICHHSTWFHRDAWISADEALTLALMTDLRNGALVVTG